MIGYGDNWAAAAPYNLELEVIPDGRTRKALAHIKLLHLQWTRYLTALGSDANQGFCTQDIPSEWTYVMRYWNVAPTTDIYS